MPYYGPDFENQSGAKVPLLNTGRTAEADRDLVQVIADQACFSVSISDMEGLDPQVVRESVILGARAMFDALQETGQLKVGPFEQIDGQAASEHVIATFGEANKGFEVPHHA